MSSLLPLLRLLLRTPVLTKVITRFALIWMRHFRWYAHLRAFRFDGVVDGGANIGEFAQVVREALPLAHLICVEPHPGCASLLRKQGFEVAQAALWNERTTLDLFQDGLSSSCTLMKERSGHQVAKVQAIRLCDLPIRGNRLLIKLDLQGAERVALEALGDMEKRCAGFLLEVSLSPRDTFEDINRLLLSKNYILFASVNEFFSGNWQIESDILWIKKEILQELPRDV